MSRERRYDLQLKLALRLTVGIADGLAALILSTFSMLETTLPSRYWRSRKAVSPKQMKNCELAESGTEERAIETVARARG